MLESCKAWIGADGIKARKLREDPGRDIPEAEGGFEPFKSRISVAESGIKYNESHRRCLALRRKLFEFFEQEPGFPSAAKPRAYMTQEG